jgi:hypothetical protein
MQNGHIVHKSAIIIFTLLLSDRELYTTISPGGRYLIVVNSATFTAETYMNQLLPTTFDDLEHQIAEAVSTP